MVTAQGNNIVGFTLTIKSLRANHGALSAKAADNITAVCASNKQNDVIHQCRC